ncbi:ankyrin repeat domain-containing protein [Acidocella sp.]|jgi:hypothetical protein|uniref:ankyrin repeat domain-containing protein n=1 Tax=Acidocella sp. TaxID=50710 RepID=UPI002F3F3584
MKTVVSAFALVLSLAATPALAQMAPGMGGMGGSMGGGNAPQPRQRVPDIAPAGVPGAVTTPLATGPNLQKPGTGDPTAALFTAIDKNDYGAAQDAVSRGANLGAQNPLGETPLDMSVALNRSTITFMLLAARNEEGGGSTAPAPAAPPAGHHHAPASTLIISDRTAAPRPVPVPVPVMGDNPGTPDPAAGFLGFGSKQ